MTTLAFSYDCYMTTVTSLEDFQDALGNQIIYPSAGLRSNTLKPRVKFHGSNNKLVVSREAEIAHLNIEFDCNNGVVNIGASEGVAPLRLYARVGQDCIIKIGNNVSTTDKLTITAAEGTTVVVGDDSMIATDVELRTDDAHPIFDVATGERLNPSQSIYVGNHVWLAKRAIVMGGVNIGEGAVVGFGSIVTKNIPNNCVAVGAPARVVRRNVAWERPHLSGDEPFYKPHAGTVEKTGYWNLTKE